MEHRTWQETQQHLGMPAARSVEQSILLAQLEILRKFDPMRVASAKQTFRTSLDEI